MTAKRSAERTSLVKEARALGLKPLKRHTDAELESMILYRIFVNQIAAASKKKGKKVKQAEPQKDTGWPVEWGEDQKRNFYLRMVHDEMPDDEVLAYQQVLEKMVDMVPHVSVRATPLGYDCLGVSYTPGFECCDKLCPDTPLCKVICEQRPELVQLANALAKTRGEVNELSEDEVQEAVEAQEQLQPKKTTKKKKTEESKPAAKAMKAKVSKVQSGASYLWTNEHKVSRYKSVVDPEALEIYRWMAKRSKRSFTRDELVERVKEIAEHGFDEYADETLEYLLEDEAIKLEA